jgi:hypothetical protein
MCDSCNPGGINRRQFVGRTLKASGLFSLAMAGGYGAMGTGIFFGESSLSSADNSLAKLKKEPARVKVVFLYPPADVVNAGKNEDNWAPEHWFTWPGNQFEPEMQERVFTSKIESIADRLGVVADFAPQAVFQRAKVDEFIGETQKEGVDAVLVVNFWNTFSGWSFDIATQAAPAAIVYQPVGSNHQLPPLKLRETKGIYYIHSIENWDEIERGLLAVRARKMLAQSRLLRVSDQSEAMVQNREEFLHTEIVGVSAKEFNDLFDSIKADRSIVKEAMKLKKDAKSVMDVDDLYFVEGIRSHYAVNKIMEKYGADAITIQCLMLKHRKPCMSFSINNGNLVPCGCENHLDGTLTQMLGRWLFERAGFMHNPEFDTSNNHYFASHCTCATKLRGPNGPEQDYLVRPFFHQLPKTAAMDVQWTSGEQVMLTKYLSGEKKVACWTGKVIESPKSPPTGGCATRVLVEIDKADDVCEAYHGAHPILFCGDRGDARKVKAFAQMYDVDLAGNI